MAAYLEAARRDPRRAGCGYIAGDPATGALGAFLWFASPGELIAFLQGPEVELLAFEPDDERRIAASLRRVTRGVRSIARLDREALTAAFEGWTEIVWLGTFADLVGRGGSFVTDVRLRFRCAHGLGEHAGPIADDELDAFVHFLRAPDVDEPDAE